MLIKYFKPKHLLFFVLIFSFHLFHCVGPESTISTGDFSKFYFCPSHFHCFRWIFLLKSLWTLFCHHSPGEIWADKMNEYANLSAFQLLQCAQSTELNKQQGVISKPFLPGFTLSGYIEALSSLIDRLLGPNAAWEKDLQTGLSCWIKNVFNLYFYLQ